MTYPATRRYTSFSQGDMLDRGQTGDTAFRGTPHATGSAWVLFAATLTYHTCGWHARTRRTSTGFVPMVRD